MSEMTVLHSNSIGGEGSPTSLSSKQQQQRQPKVETATNIIRQLATRSTIYQRNETRRTRTLAQKDDPRPAVVRVLSGLPGTRNMFPPYDPSSTEQQQQQQKKKAQRQHGTGTTTTTKTGIVNAAAAAGAAVLEEGKEDGNIFTVHSASETDAALVQTTAAASVRGTVLSTAAAAAVGGVLSETLFGKGSPSSSSSSPFLANNNKRVPSKTPKIVPVVQHDMLAFLKKAATATVSSSTTTTTTAANHNTNAIPPSVYPKMVTTAISASFLFGTKALVEASLTGNKDEDSQQVRDDDDVVLSMASIVSSAIAGGAMGTARQALGSATTSAKGLLGREVVGATLYFSSYELVKSLVLGVGAGSSDHEADGRRMRTPLWIVAVAAGGGVAGVTYEAIRAPATATVSAGTMRPFALTAAAAGQQRPMSLGLAAALRSAPAHAVLFLGYEIARGQLS